MPTQTATDPIGVVLAEMERTGVALGDGGERVEIGKFAISTHAGLLLERAVTATQAETIIEVGCASARSTLHLARGAPHARLELMDPKQTSHWKGIGRRAIERAGLGDRVRMQERCAHEALPELLADGVRVDFAFIDGWHMLDYVMVEAHYIDLMCNLGGVIAIHDLWMPALQHFSAFWASNRAYEPVTIPEGATGFSTAPYDLPIEAPRRGVGDLGSAPRLFTERLAPFVDRTVLLLRKIGEDTRRWDEFNEFAL